MTKLETKDPLGAPVKIDQYGGNMILINSKCDILIDKDLATAIVKTLSENFEINNNKLQTNNFQFYTKVVDPDKPLGSAVIDEKDNVYTHGLMHEKDAELIADLLNASEPIYKKLAIINHSI